MEVKMETKRIIDELKKARDLPEPEKSRQLAAGFEALGDYFVEQSEIQIANLLTCHRTALKAISIYNLALASAQLINDDQTSKKLVKKIQSTESAIIKRSKGKIIHQSLASYEQEIEYWKKRLHQLRINTQISFEGLDLSSPNIQIIYQAIAVGLKSIINEMIESCFNVMPSLPEGCTYSIIALGSLAREEATPFSDFEWAIIIGENNDEHKDYFRRLTELLWIKILNLGETTARMMDVDELSWFDESESPCKKGFSFDGQMLSGCHTPLGNRHHTASKIRAIEQNSLLSAEEKDSQIQSIKDSEYELIGTPEELANFQTQRWETKRGFCTVLSTVTPIIINGNDLLTAYEIRMAEIWRLPVESNPNLTLIQKRSFSYLSESIERFQFRGGHFGEEVHYFDAKYHLYRLPNMLLDHLSSYFSIQYKNLWERIERIFGETGVVHFPEKANALKIMVSQVLGVRLKAYINKSYREDHILMFDPQNPEKNKTAIIKFLEVDEALLLQIYSEFVELQARMEMFIESGGEKDVLKWQYGDLNDFTRGQIYRLLLNYPKAKEAYEKAIKQMGSEYGSDYLFIGNLHNNLGVVCEAQGNYPAAVRAFKDAIQIWEKYQVLERPAAAGTINNLGAVYFAQMKYDKAIKKFIRAYKIREKLFDPLHISIAESLNNIGGAYQSLTKYHAALVAYERAKVIMPLTGHALHSFLEVTLSNLGAIYRVQGRYKEALAVFEEAMRRKISAHGPRHLSISLTLNNLGNVYASQSKYPAAIAAYEETKLIMIEILGYEHPMVADTMCNIGSVFIEQKKFDQARNLFQDAHKIYDRAKHPKFKQAKTLLGLSYLREGNDYMLQEAMDVEKARVCYEKVDSTLDPQSPETHKFLANDSYNNDKFTAALEHNRILIKLDPYNALAHHNLACLFHVQGKIEQSKDEGERAKNYIKKAEDYFERAIQLDANTVNCMNYAQFLLLNRIFDNNIKIIKLLQRAIILNQQDQVLKYNLMDRPILYQHLQELLDMESPLFLRAKYLAYYLLIQAYCATDQLPAAQALRQDFEAQISEDKEAYEITQLALCAQFSEMIEADPDNTKHYEEQLRQQSLTNEKQQRLHAKLVEGSEAAIERCIASPMQKSKQSPRSPTLSPRLLRDSPILVREATKKTISGDEEIEAFPNPNL